MTCHFESTDILAEVSCFAQNESPHAHTGLLALQPVPMGRSRASLMVQKSDSRLRVC